MTRTVCIDDTKKTYYLMAEISIKTMRKNKLPEEKINNLFHWTEITGKPLVMLWNILTKQYEIINLEEFINCNDLNKYYICAFSYYKEYKEKK